MKDLMPLEDVKKRINYYPNWPVEGVNFVDILPLLSDARTFGTVIEQLNGMVTAPSVVAPEARGFLFASPLLVVEGGVTHFVPFRKSGKLPAAEGDLQKVPIVKEYGEDSLFFRRSDLENAPVVDGVIEVSVIDDILATGGTAAGMAEHLNSLKIMRDGVEVPVRVKEFVFIVDLTFLNGKSVLEGIAPVKSFIEL